MIQGATITGGMVTFQAASPAGLPKGLHKTTVDTTFDVPRHPHSQVAQVSMANTGLDTDVLFVTKPAMLEPIGKLSIAAAIGGVLGILLGKYAL